MTATKRGGRRPGAGRPRSGRVRKTVSLPPAAWAFIATEQAARGGSENDALERVLLSHPQFALDPIATVAVGSSEEGTPQ